MYHIVNLVFQPPFPSFRCRRRPSPPAALAPFLYFASETQVERTNERYRCSRDASPLATRILRGSGARATLANMARQVREPFERIWPIKRGLRAALSSGLTQSTSFLSARPLSPSLSTSISRPLPRSRRHPSGALCYSWLHRPTPLLPPTPTGCFSSPAPSTTVPIDELATTGL